MEHFVPSASMREEKTMELPDISVSTDPVTANAPLADSPMPLSAEEIQLREYHKQQAEELRKAAPTQQIGARISVTSIPINYWGSIRSACFSPDGKHIACSRSQGGIHLLDWSSETVNIHSKSDLRGRSCAWTVTGLSFSSSGRWLTGSDAVGSGPESKERHFVLDIPKGGYRRMNHRPPMRVCFSPDGKKFATVNDGDCVCLFQTSSGKYLRCLDYEDSSDEDSDDTGDDSRGEESSHREFEFHDVNEYDPRDEKDPDPKEEFGDDTDCQMLAFTSNGEQVVSCDQRGYIKVCDVLAPACTTIRARPGFSCLSPTGTLRALNRSKEAGIVVEEIDSRFRRWFLSYKNDEKLTGLRISRNDKLLAATFTSRVIRLWDIGTGEEWVINTHSDKVSAVCFSDDSTKLAFNDHAGSYSYMHVCELSSLVPSNFFTKSSYCKLPSLGTRRRNAA